MKENCSSYEIVVSEDGSTDGTDRILKELAGREIITHLHSGIRLGKGKAVRNAFFASSGERVFFTDADFPMEMEDIPKMLGLLGRYNMVIGSRSKGISAERSFARKMFSISYNSFVRLLFRTGIRDHQCGVKAFRREAVKEAFSRISSGFLWDTELIVRAKREGCSIFELPIRWQEKRSGRSKVSVYRDSYRMGKALIKFWYHMNFGRD
ncbi:MAG: glycosyltransferase [Candidatus Aenigmarchaeota archaeon]|nr:glycosyltransferase [Candidatus Aenigmarchaeota archaeon]